MEEATPPLAMADRASAAWLFAYWLRDERSLGHWGHSSRTSLLERLDLQRFYVTKLRRENVEYSTWLEGRSKMFESHPMLCSASPRRRTYRTFGMTVFTYLWPSDVYEHSAHYLTSSGLAGKPLTSPLRRIMLSLPDQQCHHARQLRISDGAREVRPRDPNGMARKQLFLHSTPRIMSSSKPQRRRRPSNEMASITGQTCAAFPTSPCSTRHDRACRVKSASGFKGLFFCRKTPKGTGVDCQRTNTRMNLFCTSLPTRPLPLVQRIGQFTDQRWSLEWGRNCYLKSMFIDH